MTGRDKGILDLPSPPQVAVIGCGYWGRNLVRNFHSLGALAAVNDEDPKVAQEIRQRYSVPARSFPEILEDPDVDGVVIATPAIGHHLLAREALTAGKHVFVEKPLSLDVDDAADLCRIAEETSLTLMVGHLMRYHPAFIRLAEMVEGGELGNLQYLASTRLNLGKVRQEENILWSFAPHDISMILALVGASPIHVRATGGMYLNESVADVTTTHLEFPGGEKAHIFVSWLHPFKEQKLVVVGDRSMAVLDDRQPWQTKLQHYPHRIDWQDGVPLPVRADMEPIPIEEQEPLLAECRTFLRCVAERTTPPTDGQEGLRVLRVLQAAESSMHETSQSKGRSRHIPNVFIHESAYVDEGVDIGEATKVWHFTHVLPRSTIGRACTIGQNVMIGPEVNIGDGCKIQNNVSLYAGVTLEDDVFCGPSCVFTNVANPRAMVDRKAEFRSTRVGKGATIGANATIICGNDLGAYCFVGAGAVVTKTVPPHALVVGNPAEQVGWVSHAGERLGEDLICPRTGRRYELDEDGLLRTLPGD